MKLRIKDTEYDWDEALAKADLRDLRELSKAAGIGERSIRAMLNTLFQSKTEDEANEVGERVETIDAMRGLVFLCLRQAGDATPFAEIGVAYSDLGWVIEEGDIPDPDPEPDPTEAAGNPPPSSDENENEPTSPSSKPSVSTSKTSKPRSTSTS